MTWLQRYRIRSYVANSIWILLALAVAAAFVFLWLLLLVDKRRDLPSADAGAAREVLGVLAASTFTLIVFVSSSLLLAVQLASAQLTPRAISFVFRDRVMKFSLAAFVFTFTFALTVQLRISHTVPVIATRIAGYGSLFTICFFLYMIDHLGKLLRPSGVLNMVFAQGLQVVSQSYPRPFDPSTVLPADAREFLKTQPTQTVSTSRGGVILALDVRGLVELAEKSGCFIEMVPQVGDFVAKDELLFRIYGGGGGLPDKNLHDSVAIGSERTIEQDPGFPFRVIVDIASKGLSPAINDPTTAVLAIDQIHRLLRNVGHRNLDEGHVRDAQGRVRFIYPTPDWEDFVQLAVVEIRQFGGVSIQIARRLREMLENLIQTLPGQRTPPLRHELDRLQRSAERFFAELDDVAMATVSDSQGVGGSRLRGTRNFPLDN